MFHRRFLLFLSLDIFIVLSPVARADWLCFHGPRRDNLSSDTGLAGSWPEGGPPLLWTASDIGHGYSSVAIADGRIFTAGMIDKQTYVTALDWAGRQLWQRLNGQSWEAGERQPWAVPYSGSRGTPTVDGDTVYHLSELGRLTAFDVATGQERWHLGLLETFKAEPPEYGYSESVLILGDVLFCCPAGDAGYAAALDKATGRTRWANTDVKDPAGNGSFVAAEIGGVGQFVALSATRVLAFAVEDGRLLWEYPFANDRENNAADAIVKDGLVYASSGYGGGSVLLRPRRQADDTFIVEQVWRTDLLDNHHGGVILVDGHLYGAGHEARGWFCLDFSTGAQRWQSNGKGALTYADGMLYCCEEKGTLSLVRATPKQWDAAGSFQLPRGGSGLYWAHPVVFGGRLYVRHSDRLFAYDIRGAQP
ncbi:MAG: PQQ-like beta-propeller repeat protein [Sedimentisphaerales bacterium]|nr:PQQ-like beta-propeller repeat protein [Sedimentisphaerales bacterium]